MNNQNNAWTTIIEVVDTFRYDPPHIKLTALLIVGAVVLAFAGMLLLALLVQL